MTPCIKFFYHALYGVFCFQFHVSVSLYHCFDILFMSLAITFLLGLTVPQGTVFLVTRNRFS
jgi:succinate-acetate transporter protein